LALEPDLFAEMLRHRIEGGYSIVVGDPECVYGLLAEVGERFGGGWEVLSDDGVDVFAAVRTGILASVLGLDLDPLREAAFVFAELGGGGRCGYTYFKGERGVLGRELAREAGIDLSARRLLKLLQNRFV